MRAPEVHLAADGRVTVGHGIRRVWAPDEQRLDEALRADLIAWQHVMPHSAVVTGPTAAVLHGLWLPPLPKSLPHFWAMGTVPGEVFPVRRELLVSRHPTPPASIDSAGLRLAPIPDTVLACARVFGVLDEVVLIDSALRLGVPPADLLAAARPRRRGSPRLRLALGMSDHRSESPWESIARVFHQAIGVSVTPQVELFDADGVFLGRADLLLDGTNTLHEYDGADHLSPRQQRRDLRRARDVIRGGFTRRAYTSAELIRQPIIILRDCDATLGRAHDPARLIGWRELLRDSLYAGWGGTHLERLCEQKRTRPVRRQTPLPGTDTGY